MGHAKTTYRGAWCLALTQDNTHRRIPQTRRNPDTMIDAYIYKITFTRYDQDDGYGPAVLQWAWASDPTTVITNEESMRPSDDWWLAADDGTAGPSPVFFEV